MNVRGRRISDLLVKLRALSSQAAQLHVGAHLATCESASELRHFCPLSLCSRSSMDHQQSAKSQRWVLRGVLQATQASFGTGIRKSVYEQPSSLQFDVQESALLPRQAPVQHRCISVDQHGEVGEELSEKDYHRFADLTLGELMVKLEALIEEASDLADSDLEYSQGVLTMHLGSHGTYVINKQSPNKQIWMSSPLSGPVRYDFVDGRWVYKHDGHAFEGRLTDELRQITGREELQIEFEPQLEKGFVGYGADPT